MNADFGAGPGRRHRPRHLVNLRIRTNADLEMLRPDALRDEDLLQSHRLVDQRMS